jgi:hypothetical protein
MAHAEGYSFTPPLDPTSAAILDDRRHAGPPAPADKLAPLANGSALSRPTLEDAQVVVVSYGITSRWPTALSEWRGSAACAPASSG